MSVVFLGDIAMERAVAPATKFNEDLVIANLEGAIISSDRLRDRVVYNTPESISFLKESGINAVSLANNHIFDVGKDLSRTHESLLHSDILFTGAGKNIDEASKPIEKKVDGVDVVVFAAGWSVIGCVEAGANQTGALPLDPKLLFSLLERSLDSNPMAKVIFYIHWNYELELYPQPAHRRLAFDLIHAGAAAIIGAHSHCVQGVERVGDGFVAHGLGNWMFPHKHYFNGVLAFPEFSKEQFACHFDVHGTNHRIDWYQFEDNNSVRKTRETAIDSNDLNELTPYRGMSHKEYVSWFRANRRKKKLLPVYVDYRHAYRNQLKNKFVRARQFMIDKLVESGLKGAPK